MAKPWFRVNSEIIRHRKFRDLPAEDICIWLGLMCMAYDEDKEGLVGDIDDIAFGMRSWGRERGRDRGASDIEAVIDRLVERGLIDRVAGGKRGVRFSMHDWLDYQAQTKASGERLNGPHVRGPTLPTLHNKTNKPTARAAREPASPVDGLTSSQSKPEQQKVPVRPVEENDDAEMAAEPDPVFQALWDGYLEFGDSRSPMDRALALWQQLDDNEQRAAAEGLVIWALIEGRLKQAQPDRKCKYFDTWLNGRMWRQESLAKHPEWGKTVKTLVAKWYGETLIEEPEKRSFSMPNRFDLRAAARDPAAAQRLRVLYPEAAANGALDVGLKREEHQ